MKNRYGYGLGLGGIFSIMDFIIVILIEGWYSDYHSMPTVVFGSVIVTFMVGFIIGSKTWNDMRCSKCLSLSISYSKEDQQWRCHDCLHLFTINP